MSGRLIDPVAHLDRDVSERIGLVSVGEMSRRVESVARFDRDAEQEQLIIVQETLWFTRADIAANATTTLLTPFPTSSSAFGANSRSHYIPAPARLLVARLSANADVTAGTITPDIQITEGADTSTVVLDEVALDTTYVNSKAASFDWDVAPQIAAGALLAARVVTPVGFLPITIDVTLSLTLGYARWI